MKTMTFTDWIKWPLAVLLALVVLYIAFGLYATGQAAWALGMLALAGFGFWAYLSPGALPWRYLFPGIIGMLVFIAFPLAYTAQMGFTNYSSSNLLSRERATAYLLEQTEADETKLFDYALYPSGKQWRLLLTAPDGATRYATEPLTLDGRRADRSAKLSPFAAEPAALGQPANMREILQHRDGLMQLGLALPDGTGLHYAGLRQFGLLKPVWSRNPDGSLTQLTSGSVFKANIDTGFYENEAGERQQPGFTVGVGFANYARMLGDADFRGPFLSIFIWTVLFAGLTVLFSTILGLGLAVLLNWESLRFRTTYRTLLFLPYAVPGFISILVFKGLFNQNFGEINAILNAVLGVKPAWFADPTLAKVMILIVNTWLGYPYIMLLCSGLLKAIPADLYEASALAGAGPLTNFFKITAPQIVKPLTPLLISAFAFNFNNFVLIALLTDGRPDFLNTKVPAGTTDILVSYTYRIAFQDAGQNFGLAAAISTVIFVMVALMSLINLRMTRVAKEAN